MAGFSTATNAACEGRDARPVEAAIVPYNTTVFIAGVNGVVAKNPQIYAVTSRIEAGLKTLATRRIDAVSATALAKPRATYGTFAITRHFLCNDRIIPMRARRSMMRKVLCAGVAGLLMSGTAMAASAGGENGNASEGGGESRPTSQSTQSPPTVVPQNQTGAINGVTNTPGGTDSSSVPPGTTSSTGVGSSPSGSGGSNR
jgi:hypothetical protein